MWIEVQPPKTPCYVDWKCYKNELLKAENLRLKQKQIIEASNNNAETPKKKRSREEISYYFKPRPKLG